MLLLGRWVRGNPFFFSHPSPALEASHPTVHLLGFRASPKIPTLLGQILARSLLETNFCHLRAFGPANKIPAAFCLFKALGPAIEFRFWDHWETAPSGQILAGEPSGSLLGASGSLLGAQILARSLLEANFCHLEALRPAIKLPFWDPWETAVLGQILAGSLLRAFWEPLGAFGRQISAIWRPFGRQISSI